MIDIKTNDSARKSSGGPGLKRPHLLRGVLLAVAGVSQTFTATAGHSPVEAESAVWHASTVCGLEGVGKQRQGIAPLNFEDDLSGKYLSLPGDGYHPVLTRTNDPTFLYYPANLSAAATGFDAASTDLIALYDLRLPKVSGYENQNAGLPVRWMDVNAYPSPGFTHNDFKQSPYQIGPYSEFLRAGSVLCTDELTGYPPSTTDWRKPLDADLGGGSGSDEWHHLKYGYLSTTTMNWTVGAHVSF